MASYPKQFDQPLFGCFDDLVSLLIACCVPYGSAILQGMSIQTLTQGQETCFFPCLISAFACCFGSGLNRQNIRNKLNIDGTYTNDCCIHMWCDPCASCQEYRESNPGRLNQI